MFDLKVVGLSESRYLVEKNWPTRIVSLTSDESVQHGSHIPHLHVQVHDAEFADDWAIRPTQEHVLAVLAFTEDLTDEDRLLVHCLAGQSRSTAIAIGVLIQHGMMYHEAFAHVSAVRRILLPNKLFIRHIDDLFDLQNQLVEYVADWRLNVMVSANVL